MKYFRVKTGYGTDDFISINETELARAIKAQIKGGIVIFEEGSVAGNLIMAITPDYNRALGVSRDYKLTGEDYERLGGKAVKEHRDALLVASSHAQGKPIPELLESPRQRLIDSLAEDLSLPDGK